MNSKTDLHIAASVQPHGPAGATSHHRGRPPPPAMGSALQPCRPAQSAAGGGLCLAKAPARRVRGLKAGRREQGSLPSPALKGAWPTTRRVEGRPPRPRAAMRVSRTAGHGRDRPGHRSPASLRRTPADPAGPGGALIRGPANRGDDGRIEAGATGWRIKGRATGRRIEGTMMTGESRRERRLANRGGSDGPAVEGRLVIEYNDRRVKATTGESRRERRLANRGGSDGPAVEGESDRSRPWRDKEKIRARQAPSGRFR